MRLRSQFRSLGLASLVAGVLATTPLSAQAPQYFDGGGYGPSEEVAVQAAIWDAEASAEAYGLYSCEMVGEPQIFPQAPGSRRAFTAQVTLRCEP